MSKIDTLLSEMWNDYITINPAAGRIHDLLVARGETILNDHIALRTFRHPKIGLEVMARVFETEGYVARGEYEFPEKKLYAKHWEHPDSKKPKIFISELLTEKFSSDVQKILASLVEQVPPDLPAGDRFANSGRPWAISHSNYLELAKVSEYASWVAAYGFRANHFTVSFNELHGFKDLSELNAFLKSQGYRMNASGGEIKGTPQECLEQSSTLAETSKVQFSDGIHEVPSVYYEFARRYPLPDGRLYQGFIAASADKIFESTDRQPRA